MQCVGTEHCVYRKLYRNRWVKLNVHTHKITCQHKQEGYHCVQLALQNIAQKHAKKQLVTALQVPHELQVVNYKRLSHAEPHALVCLKSAGEQ